MSVHTNSFHPIPTRRAEARGAGVLEWVTHVAASREQVARFHATPRAIRRLTPVVMPMTLHRMDPLGEGSISDFTLWFGPLPVRWTARHVDVDPDGGFTDIQTRGPFPEWQHVHRYEAAPGGGTFIVERVDYRHGGGWNGLVTRTFFSRPMLRALFTYRSWVMRASLGGFGRAWARLATARAGAGR